MSCGDLFQVFGPRSVAPQAKPCGERAMRLCLSHPPPIRKLLDSYEELREGFGRPAPLPSCLNHKCAAEAERQPEAAKGLRGQKKKKKVVFADMKGFSLTAVRIFSKIEEDLCDLHQALAHLASFRNKLRTSCAKARKYLLDFPQPSADYGAFRRCLQSRGVCLEDCLVRDGSLTGTIKVQNLGYEKEVYVRVSFDGWESFCDVGCRYLPSTYGSSDTDVFSFEVALPTGSPPCTAIEFCVSFHCGQKVYWDNNNGKNYKIRLALGPPPPPPPPPSSRLSRLAKSTIKAADPLGTSRAAALVLSRLHTWRRTEGQAYW